jgi:hypothetical protein
MTSIACGGKEAGIVDGETEVLLVIESRPVDDGIAVAGKNAHKRADVLRDVGGWCCARGKICA